MNDTTTKEQLSYASVIPLRRVPERFAVLSYSYEKSLNLSRGDVVKMPFGKSEIFGVVISTQQFKPSFSVKQISTILPYQLGEKTLSAIDQIHAHYHVSYAQIVQLFISSTTLEALNKKSIQDDLLGIFEETKNYIEAAPSQEVQFPYRLYIEKSANDRSELLTKLLSRATGTTLIVLPEQYALSHIEKRLTDANINFVSYHGEINARKRATIWLKALNGIPQTIVTTRIGLFLPFRELSNIILFDEDNESYEEIRSPHYHAVDIARLLTETYGAAMSTVVPAPLFETWHACESNPKTHTVFQLTQTNDTPTQVTIVPMTEERMSGNHSALSEIALQKIAATLAQHKQVLLFINRRGVVSMTVCKECDAIASCPRCQTALTTHRNGEFKCHRCNFNSEILSACKNCGSLRQKSIGLGTQGIEDLLNKIFAQAKIIRLDSDSVKGSKERKFALSFDELDSADIIVATKIIDKPLDLPRLATSIAVVPDSLLHIPHFRAEEKALQTLARLKVNTKENLILQTYLPDSAVYQALETGNLMPFYTQERDTRKLLKLAPFNE